MGTAWLDDPEGREREKGKRELATEVDHCSEIE